MTLQRIAALILVLAVLVCVPAPAPASAGSAGPVYLPLVIQGSGNTQAGPLIIDHRHTDIYRIPVQWINAARELTFHYAHTSHGSQILTGLQYWEGVNPAYAYDVQVTTLGLPAGTGMLKMYDGNSYSDNYIEPHEYWSTVDGLNHSRATSNSSLFDYSMWLWCGQQSINSVDQVNQYLAAVNQLETEYPAMRFIYMTGHTDGGSATLARNNQMVRDYVAANNKVLFDFADMESYDPAGNYYPNASDACTWCASWCAAHPADCEISLSCAHTHPFLCKLKAQAFWWMMARLAGWNGL